MSNTISIEFASAEYRILKGFVAIFQSGAVSASMENPLLRLMEFFPLEMVESLLSGENLERQAFPILNNKVEEFPVNEPTQLTLVLYDLMLYASETIQRYTYLF